MSGWRGRLPTLVEKAREVAAAMLYEVILALSLVVIFPITVRGLGAAEYGEYTTIYVIAGFALTWVYAGVSASILQLLMQRHRTMASVLAAGRRQVLLSALPAAALGVVVVAWLLGADLVVPAIIAFASTLVTMGLAETNVAVVFSHLGVAAASRLRLIDPVVRATGVAVLGATGNVSLISLVLVNWVATTTVLVVSGVVRRRIVEDDTARTSATAREVLSLSSLYSTSMTTNSVQNEGEKLILATFRPVEEVGEYQAAYRIVSVAMLPMHALQVAAARWFLPRDERPGAHVRRSLLVSGATAVYGSMCAVGIVIGQPIVRWVLGAEFESAATITLWLALMPLFQGLAEIPPLGLIGLGQNRARTVLGLGVAAFAVVGYLVLVPWLGWQGAVIGTYVSETASIAVGWWYLLRYQARQDRQVAAGVATEEH